MMIQFWGYPIFRQTHPVENPIERFPNIMMRLWSEPAVVCSVRIALDPNLMVQNTSVFSMMVESPCVDVNWM